MSDLGDLNLQVAEALEPKASLTIPEDAADRVLAGTILTSPLGLWQVRLGENDVPHWEARELSSDANLALVAYGVMHAMGWAAEIRCYINGRWRADLTSRNHIITVHGCGDSFAEAFGRAILAAILNGRPSRLRGFLDLAERRERRNNA